MKSILFIVIVCVCTNISLAQVFQKKISWKDTTFTSVSAEWTDIDNDSLLDAVLVGKDLTSKLKISVFKNTGALSFAQKSSFTENFTLNNFTLTNFNHDNKIDLLVSATGSGNALLLSYLNNKNFIFDKVQNQIPMDASKLIRFVDLDQDGKEDLILAGENGLKILKSTPIGFELKFDTIQLKVKDASIFDFNKDGWNDIIVSGNGASGKPILMYLINTGKFHFKKINISKAVSGNITSGDFNHDGKFDFVVSGKNDQSLSLIKFFQKDSSSFVAVDSVLGYANANLLLADFDSDGLSDLSFYGKGDDGRRFNFIRNYKGILVPLDTAYLVNQSWGDFDRDGDLDILRVIDSAKYHVFQVHENLTPEKNKGPNIPGQGFAVSTFNKTIIFWGTSTDDHTPVSTITYDLRLTKENSTKEIIAPDFNFTDAKRLLVSHGKQTTNTFAIINSLVDGQYNYLIQPVDNAFNGASRGNCIGGGVLPCFNIKHEYKQVCTGDTTTLTSPFVAMWFSNSLGFLEQSIEHKFVAMANDTIISVVPHGTDCSINRIWVISVNGISTSEKEVKYVCENIPFKLGIAPGWKNVEWKVDKTIVLGGDTIELKLEKVATVSAIATSDGHCTYKKEFKINISKPELTLNGEAFQIKQGESINLEASGTKTYVWSPAEKLNNAFIPNPIASPIKMTEYTVIGTDSVGCTASAKVIVQVEETAFIPTLFTPNGDGKNDDLKIYGLTIPSEFHFLIFNREGNVVYETKDWSYLASRGWNGMHNGSQQPPGLYYWKVEGKMDGELLRLNGKTNGSILLVR